MTRHFCTTIGTRISPTAVVSGLCFACIAFLMLPFEASLAAQTCDHSKLQGTISKVEQEFGGGEHLRLHRIEELEDDLFAPRQSNSMVESPFFLYQLETRRYFIRDGKVLEQVPWGQKWPIYVAVSDAGEQVYRLAGTDDAEEDFKHLVSDFGIPAPRDSERAESRALFCAQVVFGEEPGQWILGEGQGKAMVQDRLFGRSKDAYGKTERWWRNFRQRHPDIEISLGTTKNEDGTFLTKIPLFWAPVESEVSPEIRELDIRVERDGSCHRTNGTRPRDQH